MYEKSPTIEEFLLSFDHSALEPALAEGELERLEVLKKFPFDEWSNLPLERYAYGQGNPQDTFSWALEKGSRKLAALANHGPRAFKIYFKKKEERWWYEGDFASAQLAWQSIRNIYLHAFARATAGRWNLIDELHTSHYGANALLKTLICYFPEDLLPITSTDHIAHFLVSLGVVEFEKRAQNVINLNRLLLFKLKSRISAAELSNGKLARILYAWAPPPSKQSSDVDETESSEIEDEGEPDESELTSVAQFSNANISDSLYEDILSALKAKGQVILFGPPGTGKTFSAENFAKRWLRLGNPRSNSQRTAIEGKEVAKIGEARQFWLIVSNQLNGSWNNLFAHGNEVFRGEKIKVNFQSARVGDLVFGYSSTPKQRIEVMARVSRTYYLDDNDKYCVELQPVTRFKPGLMFDDFRKNPVLEKSQPMQSNFHGTIFRLTENEVETISRLLRIKGVKLDEFLQESSEAMQSLTAKNVNDVLVRLTFHPSYSYEDFIEGLRPDLSVSSSVVLKLKDGIFKRVCKEAHENRNRRYLVLIDEINRANLAKVFGEVITVIEKTKRGVAVELPQSNESFEIPPNVFLIGTMNTADRNIKSIDLALRRRFSFIEMQPDSRLLEGTLIHGKLSLAALLNHINQKLISSGNGDRQLGHSYFMEGEKPICGASDFARA